MTASTGAQATDTARPVAARAQFVPLSAQVGMEVRGVDLSGPVDEATFAGIRDALFGHCVILLRGQSLSEEDQVGFASRLGELGRVLHAHKGASKHHPGVMFISNIRENGEPIGALPDGEMMFHHDMIHHQKPHNGTLLYSLEIPSWGGDTLFASGYAAYEALDPALRAKLEGKRARHHYNYGSTQRGDGKGTDAFAESIHPIFRTHEDTGRKAIYVNRLMTTGIEGMDDAEAAPILEKLFDVSESPEFVYTHKWRVGDVLLWDNRCSTHARTDFPDNERRLMLRTTVAGTVIPY